MLILAPCWRSTAVWLVIIGLAGFPAVAAEEVVETLAEQLRQGQLAEAERFLQQHLVAEPEHAEARFALGVVHLFSAVERLGQDQYRYGAMAGTVRNLPVLRVPVPVNPDPEPVTYDQVRQLFADFQAGLSRAEAELAKVDLGSDVKLPIDLAAIRLDLNGDGQAAADERLLAVFAAVTQRRPVAAPDSLPVKFDAGDVPWLRGYCHFLMGFCDLVLAYDHQSLFDHTGQLLYPRHQSTAAVAEPLDIAARDGFERHVLDLIAAIHLMDFPLREPRRMESARQHFLTMIRTSRESWKLILAETDNDREWLPNPNQTGALGIPVTGPLIDGWHDVLVEMEDLLEGRKLVPFWRDYSGWFGSVAKIPEQGRGVNLKRFFSEPGDFDLVMMIQGTAALPYVEQGTLSRPETWRDLTRVFGGQFFGFAVWFN